jgi:hypothetical protein
MSKVGEAVVRVFRSVWESRDGITMTRRTYLVPYTAFRDKFSDPPLKRSLSNIGNEVGCGVPAVSVEPCAEDLSVVAEIVRAIFCTTLDPSLVTIAGEGDPYVGSIRLSALVNVRTLVGISGEPVHAQNPA